jgi:two-component system, OmpR family, sensor kinase
VKHLPIRVRVAAAFALAMVIVLAGTGMFLYARLGDDLAHALDQDLRLRAQDLSALARDPASSLAAESRGRLIERGESFAQLLDRDARVRDGTRPLASAPLLGAAQLATIGAAPRFFDRPSVPGLDEPARLLVVPVTRRGQSLVLVVGAR